jgi:putative ABC transport system permease protein
MSTERGTGDISFALRTIARNPGFAAVVVATLAIGIGATTAVFSAVNAVMLRPLPYSQPGQLVRLYQADVHYPLDKGFLTPVHFLDLRRDLSMVDGVAATLTYDEVGADVGTGNSVRRVRALPVSSDYFEVMRVRPELGRGIRQDEETGATAVVLSHRLWLEQFSGDPSAVGRALTMNGAPYTVVGVMPEQFQDPIVSNVDAWIPVNLTPGRDVSNADNHYFTSIVRLKPTVTIEQAQAELGTLMQRLEQKYPNAKDATAHYVPLHEDIVGSSSRVLEILLGAVGLVLLLVCVNVANLLLVRSSDRAREFAVRSALGAERSRLVRQMAVESVVLALAGDIGGLIVAKLAMRAIVALGAGSIPRLASLSLDPVLLVFSIGVSTVAAILFGLAPAIRVARTQPADVLRGQSRSSTSGVGQVRLREWLVVAQVALALVLLVGTGLLISSLRHLHDLDLGIRSAGVGTFELHLPAARYDSTARAQFYDDLPSRIEAIPGVVAAGGISRLPVTGSYHTWGTTAKTGPLANTRRGNIGANQRVIAGDYFRAMHIPLIAGRVFDAHDDATAPSRAVVSKTLVNELFPGTNPIGQTIRTAGRDYEIIGVVGDVALDNEGTERPYVYHAHRQFAGDRNWSLTQVVETSSAVPDLDERVRKLVQSLDPALVVYKPMLLDDVIGRGEAERVLTARILAAFAGISIVLAALGLFGLLSYGVRLRAREFGIRMALGAHAASIRSMVMRQAVVVTAIGLLFGVAGAAGASKLMTSVLFHVRPLDPVVVLGATTLLASVALVATLLPARRATSVEPRSVLD